MPTVYIPSLLQTLTNNKNAVEVNGTSIREVIENLEQKHPGLKDRLLENNQLRSNISVAIDGEITPLGLIESVKPNSEIHFVAAIKGGRCDRSMTAWRTFSNPPHRDSSR